MVKWTEVNAYSGMPVDEDAPTNATGAAVAGTGDDSSVVVVRKKKKKTFLDARTKAYKEHQKRLEAARARREERKKNAAKINEGQLDEREKGIDSLPRQFLNPDKEVMIVKKGKVVVINKKDQDRYMRQGWELAEKQIDEMKKVEITLNNPNDVKKIKKDVIDLTNKKRKVNITMKQMGKKLIIDGGDYDITREVKDIRNFIGYKDAKVVEDIQPKTFSQKVQEQIGEFGREAFLAENNMDVIKSIVKSKGAKDLKMKDGKLKMDAFTASAISQVYDKVNPANKKKMEDLANGKKSDLMKLQKLAMKFVK